MFVDGLLTEVRQAQAATRSLVRRLAPGDVPLSEVATVWEAFDRIERDAAAAKMLLAARVEESRAWARSGGRSAEEHLARRSGVSRGAARRGLETSKRLQTLPTTEAALRRGELSQAQVETIADAAAVNPAAEQSLVDSVRESTLQELREKANRAKAAGDPDPEATHRRLRRERRLRRYTDGEGAWCLSARGTADAGAVVNAALDGVIDEIFRAARREGRHETREAYAFDGLLELARRARGETPTSVPAPADAATSAATASGTPAAGSTSTDSPAPIGDPKATDGSKPTDGSAPSPAAEPAAPPASDLDAVAGGDRSAGPTDTAAGTHPGAAEDGTLGIGAHGNRPPTTPAPPPPPAPPPRRAGTNPSFLALLRVDLAALVRAQVEGDEMCEIAGIGPVPATVARGLLGDAVLKLVVTRGTDVANVTSLGRGPTAAQRIALLWESPACTNSRCDHTLAIQHDHRIPWAENRETKLGNLDRLCPSPCHRLKTHEGWALVAGTGRRPLVPPDDPRHPDNAARTSDRPAPPDRPGRREVDSDAA